MNPLGVLLLALTTALPAAAQTGGQAAGNRPIFAFIGIKADPKMASDTRILENRLLSELVKLGVQENFSLLTPKNRDELLKEIEFSAPGASKDGSRLQTGTMLAARGIIGGELLRVGENYYLHLEIMKPDSLATVSAAENKAASLDGLLGDLKKTLSVLYELPEAQPLPSPQPPAAGPEAKEETSDNESWAAKEPSLKDLAGTWKGDKGIESVKIKSDGSAVANLGGWNSMKLTVAVEDDQVVVCQDEPNSPKLYMNTFPYSIAVQAAELARPMRWVFSLSQDKKMLKGIKESTYFQIDKGKVLSADNSYSRSAVWIRTQ